MKPLTQDQLDQLRADCENAAEQLGQAVDALFVEIDEDVDDIPREVRKEMREARRAEACRNAFEQLDPGELEDAAKAVRKLLAAVRACENGDFDIAEPDIDEEEEDYGEDVAPHETDEPHYEREGPQG